jgi:predicted PolB exonuclease-like 3'-5' exonuclease
MELFHFDIETCGNYEDFDSFRMNDMRGANLFELKYKTMNWEQQYQTIENAYLQQCSIISTYGKICCISVGYLDNYGRRKINSYYGDNEKDIIINFNNILEKISTKLFTLSGYRILYFDIPWILHKLAKYEIRPAHIINVYDKKPWDLRIKDISDDWKQKFSIYSSFDEVCYELDIKSSKDEMSGKDVHSYYWNGKLEDIKKYCEKDINCLFEVAEKIYV